MGIKSNNMRELQRKIRLNDDALIDTGGELRQILVTSIDEEGIGGEDAKGKWVWVRWPAVIDVRATECRNSS